MKKTSFNKADRSNAGKPRQMTPKALKASVSPRDEALKEYNKRHTVSYGGGAMGGCG